ncbi:MAG: 16S rRNA (guanine(527)-N(7))-methyltransferase RsmG [Chloroflexi bacterium]|nr:16S rRNA (guanine(527)-N(7))-methyltransferase RsmG [Chloroflexota bacterium]
MIDPGQLKALGLSLDSPQRAAFERYADLLIKWNGRINLTAITDREAIAVRHFLDSLSCLTVLRDQPAGTRLIDVGSGAGFPGLPLAIARPDWHITVNDATGKKVRFLQTVVDSLALTKATALPGRAEEIGQHRDHRESYDWALARSVAALPILLEYLLPLVKTGGQALAMKAASAAHEIEQARRALEVLGGSVTKQEIIDLPDVDEAHLLIVIEKVVPTPTDYPRRPGRPSTKPH